MAEEQGAAPNDARLMPSWTPSEPHDEQREPKSSAPAPTPASEVDAARRLLDTRDSVTAIAYEVGFEDLSNFTRAFRAEFSVNPRAWRTLRGREKAVVPAPA